MTPITMYIWLEGQDCRRACWCQNSAPGRSQSCKELEVQHALPGRLSPCIVQQGKSCLSSSKHSTTIDGLQPSGVGFTLTVHTVAQTSHRNHCIGVNIACKTGQQNSVLILYLSCTSDRTNTATLNNILTAFGQGLQAGTA